METSAMRSFASMAQARAVRLSPHSRKISDLIKQSRQIPRTGEERLRASLSDQALDLPVLFENAARQTTHNQTYLYLGYGSNLSAETFLGKRQIRPLSQINVVVLEIALSFNLPGIPYTEPCFANSRYRKAAPGEKEADYHKDHWSKGLVGVVYEVTEADYAHIIATEGGGSGYQDVLVDCYSLSINPKDKVPSTPSGQAFKAHTLFAPESVHDGRPDPSYAQPSARYLKLITDGAAEHNLPYEYQDFLHQIRTYRLTTTQQRLGQFVFLTIWAPIFLFMFNGAARIFLRPDGTYPPWFAAWARATFMTCWASYDGFFKPLFGDGERTIGQEEDGHEDCGSGRTSEKAPLIRESIERYGIHGRLDTMV